jgi:hypothetical protein
MEEERIIRPVTEDESRLVYQFTAEVLVDDDPDNPHLEYTPELTIEIDKAAYFAERDFDKALKCGDAIRSQLVQSFNEERETFRSSDITRYVQKIFREQADIISLRQQGSVYFVPSIYGELITKVAQVLESIPGDAQFDFFPLPDVQSARNSVSRGVTDDITENFARMEEEIEIMRRGAEEVTDRWLEHRQEVVKKIKKRLAMYSDVLDEAARSTLGGKADFLQRTLGARLIEI